MTATRKRTAATPGRTATHNPAESPIAWLRKRKDRDGVAMISQAQFDAGERLRADFWFAQMTPRVTMNWSTTSPQRRSRRSGLSFRGDSCMQDRIEGARERVRRALAAVGPELAGILIDVCCHLKGLEEAERTVGWPQRSGKVVLQLALSCLARHYGLGQASTEAAGRPAQVRHWGGEDYRPAFELPAE